MPAVRAPPGRGEEPGARRPQRERRTGLNDSEQHGEGSHEPDDAAHLERDRSQGGPLGSWPERAATGFTLPLGVETVAPSDGLTHLNGTFPAWDLDARARPSSAPSGPCGSS